MDNTHIGTRPSSDSYHKMGDISQETEVIPYQPCNSKHNDIESEQVGVEQETEVIPYQPCNSKHNDIESEQVGVEQQTEVIQYQVSYTHLTLPTTYTVNISMSA